MQGRFTSVDPENADAELESPQSWNGYAYARNNPQRYTDPTGEGIRICGSDGKCYEHKDKDFGNLRKHCEATGGCRIVDDRLTGGRIFQRDENGDYQQIATFGNDFDGTRAGKFVTEMNRDQTWDRATVGAIFNVTVGRVLSRIFGRSSASTNTPGLPKSAPKPLGRGSTGRTTPSNLKEQLAMEQAMSNPAAGGIRPLRKGMTDSKWPASDGWVKMSQNVNGVEVHYVRNTRTGEVDDFKFID